MNREVLTTRLRIRDFVPGDLEPLVEIFAKPEVWRFPFERAFTPEETDGYLRRRIDAQVSGSASPAAVEERTTGRLLGYIALSPPDWLPEVMPAVEIGWRLDPPYWGQGLATEGARAMLDYGFDVMGLTEILSIYEPDNIASGQVMKRLGMRFLRKTMHPYFGRPLHIYAMSAADREPKA